MAWRLQSMTDRRLAQPCRAVGGLRGGQNVPKWIAHIALVLMVPFQSVAQEKTVFHVDVTETAPELESRCIPIDEVEETTQGHLHLTIGGNWYFPKRVAANDRYATIEWDKRDSPMVMNPDGSVSKLDLRYGKMYRVDIKAKCIGSAYVGKTIEVPTGPSE